MRGATPRKFPFVSRVEPPRLDRAEPRLLPPNEPLPFRRPAGAPPGHLSAAQDQDRAVVAPLAISALDRPPGRAAGGPIGSLLSLVLAGFVILAIGAGGGVAFMHFIGPAPETKPAAPPAANSPTAAGTAGPVSPPASLPHPALTAVIPGPPLTRHAAADNAAPKSPQVGAAAAPSPPSDRAAPASAAPASGHAAERPILGAAAATKAPAAATGSVRDRRAASPSADGHRPAHPRTAELHTRHRSRATPSRRSRTYFARSSAPPAAEPTSSPTQSSATASDQAASFARLMMQLTEPTKPAGQSLSPPAAGTPDPFAPAQR